MSKAAGNHLGPEFAEAVAYAIDAHGEQVRKATDITYVSHLLSVAALVLEMGSSQDEAIAGLLHDTIEDAGGPEREADIARRFERQHPGRVRVFRKPNGGKASALNYGLLVANGEIVVTVDADSVLTRIAKATKSLEQPQEAAT